MSRIHTRLAYPVGLFEYPTEHTSSLLTVDSDREFACVCVCAA
jgi:hypothetical protein